MRSVLIVLMLAALCSTARAQAPRFIEWPRDTVTARGRALKYVQATDTTYAVVWGDGRFERRLGEYPIGYDLFVPRLVAESEGYLVLEQRCGTPCWYAHILPVDESGAVVTRFAPKGYDLARDLVAYVGEGDTLLWVEDFSQGVRWPVIETPCGTPFNGYCFGPVRIEGDEVVLRMPESPQNWRIVERRFRFRERG